MIDFAGFERRGLIKRAKPDFAQIQRQMHRARRDLQTFELVAASDPEWAATIAYQSMLRVGRALLYSHGYLPADGQQHKTVVELTGIILGPEFQLLVGQFERLRRKRNSFFYESKDAGSNSEARKAAQTAGSLLDGVYRRIAELNPQQAMDL